MKRFLKWTGLVIASLLILLLIAGSVLYTLGGSALEETYAIEPALTSVPSDSASIAWGEHIMQTHFCQECHGQRLEGSVFVDAPPFRITATNLTPGEGGIGQTYSDADWDRAIRHGVRPDGRPNLIMPSPLFHQLSDEDTAALISYLKNLPPVDNVLPPTEVRTPGRMMAAVAFDVAESVVTAPTQPRGPTPGPTAEYGSYLARNTCTMCHGDDLRGNPEPFPGSPPAPDLATAANWSFDLFARTLRTGVKPNNLTIDPEVMPWRSLSHLTDDEIRALHEHLKTL